MRLHIYFLVLSFVFTINLLFPSVSAPKHKLSDELTPPSFGEGIHGQHLLNTLLKDGMLVTSLLGKELKKIGVQHLTVLKFEIIPTEEWNRKLESLKEFATIAMNGEIKVHIHFVGEDVEEIKRKSLIISTGDNTSGYDVVDVLRKDFSPRFLIALMDYDNEGDLKLRKSRRRKQ